MAALQLWAMALALLAALPLKAVVVAQAAVVAEGTAAAAQSVRVEAAAAEVVDAVVAPAAAGHVPRSSIHSIWLQAHSAAARRKRTLRKSAVESVLVLQRAVPQRVEETKLLMTATQNEVATARPRLSLH